MLNIGGNNNIFTAVTIMGTRGAGFGCYNIAGSITVRDCHFTDANTSETTTPWGGNTDDFEGAAVGLYNYTAADTGTLAVTCTEPSVPYFNSGAGAVFSFVRGSSAAQYGVMTVSYVQGNIVIANFSGGIQVPVANTYPIIGVPTSVLIFDHQLGASSTGLWNAHFPIYASGNTTLETLNASGPYLAGSTLDKISLYIAGMNPLSVIDIELEIYEVDTEQTESNTAGTHLLPADLLPQTSSLTISELAGHASSWIDFPFTDIEILAGKYYHAKVNASGTGSASLQFVSCGSGGCLEGMGGWLAVETINKKIYFTATY
jgi:hypothetical protein